MTLQGVWAPNEKETENQKKMAGILSSYVTNKPRTILSGDFNVNPYTHTITTLDGILDNVFKSDSRKTSFNLKHKDLIKSPGYAEGIVDFIFTSRDIPHICHYTSDVDVSDHLAQTFYFST
ncbi:MAG TPA: hypothetical protein VEA59_00075 [Patescibacteria group bacterium]|nr:hypothetical protein [Patescibacteria group bacterium]